jgi:large subunit ribosomal protein L21
MSYAIITVGGKQYRVQEGERLLVDRLRTGEGETFTPRVLLTGGGDGEAQIAPDDVTVTARVVDHVLGEKIRIVKYRPKSGFRRQTGFRSRLSRIEIESIGSGKASSRKAAPAKEKDVPAKEAAAQQAPEDAAMPATPPDYEGLKVTEIADWAKGRHLPTLQNALEYERATAGRKGAVAALEAAIASREESG